MYVFWRISSWVVFWSVGVVTEGTAIILRSGNNRHTIHRSRKKFT
jgi:hypothetical protein